MPKERLAGAFRSPTKDEERERLVPLIKQFRQDVDALIQCVTRPEGQDVAANNILGWFARSESEQVRTKLVEAKMWAGKMLEALGNPLAPELADKAR